MFHTLNKKKVPKRMVNSLKNRLFPENFRHIKLGSIRQLLAFEDQAENSQQSVSSQSSFKNTPKYCDF